MFEFTLAVYITSSCLHLPGTGHGSSVQLHTNAGGTGTVRLSLFLLMFDNLVAKFGMQQYNKLCYSYYRISPVGENCENTYQSVSEIEHLCLILRN